MPFYDLNVAYTNHAELAHTLSFHAELGYNAIALSISVTGKLPTAPERIPISQVQQHLETIQTSKSPPLTLLTRLTLTISDAAQNHRLSTFQPAYDILALRPTTEKALQLCCTSLECDLISLDLSQRLPFVLKFKTVAAALQRGVRFEICYGPGIAGSADARRNLIGGAAALIRATRGRGIVISSEARNALGVRGPWDVINLAQVWGLGQEKGKEAVCEEAGKVVRLARLKRTSYRGVVDDVDDGGGGGAQSAESTLREKPRRDLKSMNSSSTLQQQHHQKETPAAPRTNTPNPTIMKRKASTDSPTDITTNTTNTNPTPTATATTTAPATIPDSTTTTTTPTPPTTHPLSKREQKRRSKRARLEGRTIPFPSTDGNRTGTGTKTETETEGTKVPECRVRDHP